MVVIWVGHSAAEEVGDWLVGMMGVEAGVVNRQARAEGGVNRRARAEGMVNRQARAERESWQQDCWHDRPRSYWVEVEKRCSEERSARKHLIHVRKGRTVCVQVPGSR